MGTGIAIVANTVAQIPVVLYDSNAISLKKSEQFVHNWFQKEITKKRLTEEQVQGFKKNLIFSKDIHTLQEKDVDFVVEAIVENANVKKSVLASVDRIVKKSAILASNTSSISITELASATERPSQVIGMHFMNPVPVMKLVEVIRGLQTSDQTLEITQKYLTFYPDWLQAWEKKHQHPEMFRASLLIVC